MPDCWRPRHILLASLILLFQSSVYAAQELRWGADPIGAPYVFQDPKNPRRIIGFEVDLAEALGRQLKVKTVLVPIQWDQLVPALLRGDCDVVMNGLEITEDRLRAIDFSDPYYVFAEQITVRRGDTRFHTFEDLKGHRIGTLSAALAYTMLTRDTRMIAVPYPSEPEAYKDLQLGRTDAVLLDVPIAAYYAAPNPALENVGEPIGQGFYGIGAPGKTPPS